MSDPIEVGTVVFRDQAGFIQWRSILFLEGLFGISAATAAKVRTTMSTTIVHGAAEDRGAKICFRVGEGGKEGVTGSHCHVA